MLNEQTFNPDSIDHFVEPDFPFITTSIDARKLGPGFPSDNVTTRCLALQLGNEAYACFDTDMLRWSVAWTGDFLPMVTMAQVSYRDFHNKSNEFPVVLGDPQVATGLYPGWSAGAPQFSDPRPPSPGPDLPSWGPIPAEMGRWNGVHVEGKEAVLSYTVSGTEILEKPGSITSETNTAFTRTFTISQPQQELSLVAAERQNGVKSEVQENIAMLYHGTDGDSVTVVGLADSANAELQVIDNRYVTMQVSSSNQELTNTLLIWSGSAQNIDNFKEMLSSVETQIPDVSDGGEPHWEQTVHTQGQIAPDTSAFVTDKLTLPIPNHWNRNVRAVDIDFFDGNRAAIVTFEGDVWTVEGIDQDLSDMEWNRFASGLYDPQSIAVRDGKIYVFGREGIVRFHDLNNDGEADYYENFSNGMAQSMETREWPGSMVPAPDGGFYVSKGSAGANGPQFAPVAMTGFRYGSRHSGSVLKVSADGRTVTPIADGLRMPYLGIHPETGLLTASDQQGNFVPSSPIHIIEEGDYFGVPVSKHLNPDADITQPLHWFPHRVDPSGAGQTWITSDQMGPLNGKLVHLSYGRPGLFSILFDSTDNAVQGAASVIPARYTAPTMKGAVNPGDGKLYITGFSLWGVNTEEISAILRVRHTGQPAYMPDEFKVRNGGVMIRFTEELR
ncbi:MAG: DUF6797 domain-containing protein [Balneolaceae bacterium]|nr:DUF6797 domain-containing protein [Balneolaceae bacterium]